MGGDHVLGERRRQQGAAGRRRQRLPIACDDIRDQTLVSGPIFPQDDHGLPYRPVPFERRLDFAELDPISPQLDLEVGAPRNSRFPSDRSRARSPVRYIRPPPSNGSERNRSPVRAGRSQ